MLYDFLHAALPWVGLGLFLAVSCSLLSQKDD